MPPPPPAAGAAEASTSAMSCRAASACSARSAAVTSAAGVAAAGRARWRSTASSGPVVVFSLMRSTPPTRDEVRALGEAVAVRHDDQHTVAPDARELRAQEARVHGRAPEEHRHRAQVAARLHDRDPDPVALLVGRPHEAREPALERVRRRPVREEDGLVHEHVAGRIAVGSAAACGRVAAAASTAAATITAIAPAAARRAGSSPPAPAAARRAEREAGRAQDGARDSGREDRAVVVAGRPPRAPRRRAARSARHGWSRRRTSAHRSG